MDVGKKKVLVVVLPGEQKHEQWVKLRDSFQEAKKSKANHKRSKRVAQSQDIKNTRHTPN